MEFRYSGDLSTNVCGWIIHVTCRRTSVSISFVESAFRHFVFLSYF